VGAKAALGGKEQNNLVLSIFSRTFATVCLQVARQETKG
jgi:hypothetical protein